jgi:hypothetical protein
MLLYCYPKEMESGQLRPWMRRHVIAQARKVAIPLRKQGPGSGKGRGFVWEPIHELLELRGREGKWQRGQARKV